MPEYIVPSPRNDVTPYKNRSRHHRLIDKMKSEEVINKPSRSPDTREINTQHGSLRKDYGPRVSRRNLKVPEDNNRSILNDFKSFTKSINKSEVYEKSEASNPLFSDRNAKKSALILQQRNILNNTYRNEIPKQVYDNSKATYANIRKSIDYGQRPSKYRNNQNLVNRTLETEHSPPSSNSQILYSMKAEKIGQQSVSPFTRSKRMIFEKSSGVYGNFSAMGKLDKALKELEERKNHSIAYI